MNGLIALERLQRQLDACCGKFVRRPIPLTRIEKHALEMEEAREMWRELGKPAPDTA